jgi:peptidoglycan-associated lipoprotein
MPNKRSMSCLVVLVLCAFSFLASSCSKEVVKKEEAVTPQETRPMERPSQLGPSGGRPSEESLTAEERLRREAEAAFVNQDIYFDFDKYDLTPRAREILADKAHFMKRFPTVKVLIEGHCDERGTSEYNLALGERRANAAKQYLIHLGIAENRISTISYGKERPVDPGHNEAAWAKNRRAHFVITSR